MFDVVWKPGCRVVNHFCPSIISLMVMQPRRANYPVQTRKGDITTRESEMCCSDLTVMFACWDCKWYEDQCLARSGCTWKPGVTYAGTCSGRPTSNSKECCDGECIKAGEMDRTEEMGLKDYSSSPVSGLDFQFK